MLLVIDNYDSFTYNLVQRFGELDPHLPMRVFRNDQITPDEADSGFSEVTKENFWRMWPDVREWADSLWHRLEDERATMARPVRDEELDDVGGGG